ncbi:MAG: DUF6883 domain-containing protein [Rubrobacteraceae bacterium]
MGEREPHPDAMRNANQAHIPEAKIRDYALKDPGKKRPFKALGFGLAARNWEALYDAILEELPHHPAVFNKRNVWGTYFEVVVPVRGPNGKKAPVRTFWIYGVDEDVPRLVTLYIDTDEWDRWERERGEGTETV